jgi:rod shape-determining protein MreD
MRWYVFWVVLLVLLAALESSLLPALLPNIVRPNLVLIVCGVWAAVRGADGLVIAVIGGVILDLTSSVPMGLSSAGMLLGNLAATFLDRAPIPSRLFRATTWVAVVTLVTHAVTLIGLSFNGQPVDLLYATTTVVLPLMFINPVLAIPTYVLLNGLHRQMRQREQSTPRTG